MDQGAYNAFYQGRFDVRSSAAWNWKPYWGGAILQQSGEVTGSMQVVHFHGPKPQDYRRVKLCDGLREADTMEVFKPLLDACQRVQGDGCCGFMKLYDEYLAQVQLSAGVALNSSIQDM